MIILGSGWTMIPQTNTIICGDCAWVMSNWSDGCIDLTVTSPPYDDIRDYNEYLFDLEAIANELFRVTKDGGVVVWVVNDQYVKGGRSGTSFKQALYFMDIGFLLHDDMIYLKSGFAHPSSNRYHQVWEHMFIFSKGKPKTFNPIKDRPNKWAGYTNWGKNTSRQKDGSLKEAPKQKPLKEYGMRFNVWEYSIGKGFSTKSKIAYEHPAIFPEKLARDHIISWSNEEDIVLDPMCGSGTTCVEAMKLNRQFIGIDISLDYCKLSMKRLGENI